MKLQIVVSQKLHNKDGVAKYYIAI